MWISDFFDFLKKYRYLILIIVVIIVLAHGYSLITIDDLSIDEEIYIQKTTSGHANSWLGFSRYGIAFLGFVLFPVFDGIPFLNAMLSVLLLGSTAVLLSYNIYRILKPFVVPKVAYVFLSVAILAYPSNLDYLSFNSINASVSVGLLLCAISTYLITQWIFEKKLIWYALLGALISAFTFAIYQAFVGVYLTFAVIYTLLNVFKLSLNDNKLKFHHALIIILKHAGVLLAAFLLFYLGDFIVQHITGIKSNGYTDGLSQANTFRQMGSNLLYNLKIYFGDYVADGNAMAYVVAFFILTSLLFIFKKNIKNRIILLLLSLAIVLAPFSLGVLWAGIVPRVLTALPIMIGFCGFMSIAFITQVLKNRFAKNANLEKWVMGLIVLLVISSSYTFVYYDNLSQYASHVRYVRDESFARMVATDIVDKIEDDAPAKPVVLVGNYEMKPMENGNTIGYSGSQFNYDNTHFRGIYFMNYLGFKFEAPDRTQLEKATSLATDMPIWPQDGSIKEFDDLIVVKLSDEN